MSIVKEQDKFVEHQSFEYIPTCDLCGSELPKEYIYEDARKSMRENRWKRKINEYGDRDDLCPDCQG